MHQHKQLGVMMAAIFSAMAVAGEVSTTAAEQSNLQVTIYNSNVALIKDKRQIALDKGISTVAFKDVSAAIRPETTILTADNVALLEQNFEYDLLSPETLLNKFVGKTVTIQSTNPATGEITSEQATVLANNNQPMLKIGNKIQALNKVMSIVYDDVPDNLRDKPTLTMVLDNAEAAEGKKEVELTYLSDGLNWHADYVASLVDDKTLNLKGWVTLNNDSGTSYDNAKLQLVAGEVNRVSYGNAPQPMIEMAADARVMKAASHNMKQESLFEYHLYSLARPTTIKNHQQKQVSLLEATAVPYEKELVIHAADRYGYRGWKSDEAYQDLSAEVKVTIENKKANHLGLPLPEGVIRTYQKDSAGNMQFIGEDRVAHTAENDSVTLKLGEAFDVTAKRKQTNFQQTRTAQKNAVDTIRRDKVIASYEVVFNNAKDEAVVVSYAENFSGDWTITEQSLNSEKVNSTLNRWKVSIPAKEKVTLTFTVEMVH